MGSESKQKLIDATSEMLQKWHSTSFSTKEMFRSANVAESSIHYFFGRKANLMKAAIENIYKTDPDEYKRIMVRESMCERSLVKDWKPDDDEKTPEQVCGGEMVEADTGE